MTRALATRREWIALILSIAAFLSYCAIQRVYLDDAIRTVNAQNAFIQKNIEAAEKGLSPSWDQVDDARFEVGIRKAVVRNLEESAAVVAEAIAALSTLPPGTIVTRVKFDDKRMTVLGTAANSAQAAALAKMLARSHFLTEVRSVNVDAAAAAGPGTPFRIEAAVLTMHALRRAARAR